MNSKQFIAALFKPYPEPTMLPSQNLGAGHTAKQFNRKLSQSLNASSFSYQSLGRTSTRIQEELGTETLTALQESDGEVLSNTPIFSSFPIGKPPPADDLTREKSRLTTGKLSVNTDFLHSSQHTSFKQRSGAEYLSQSVLSPATTSHPPNSLPNVLIIENINDASRALQIFITNMMIKKQIRYSGSTYSFQTPMLILGVASSPNHLSRNMVRFSSSF